MRRKRWYFPYSMVVPSLLAAVLFIPFGMNLLGHALYGERYFPPLIKMKLPADSSAISLPEEINRSVPFEMVLHVDTKELAQRMNDIANESLPGMAPQGVHGQVFPEMRAELTGSTFTIDPPEPQAQLFSNRDETHWSWTVTPEREGHRQLSVQLYLQTTETTAEQPKVVNLAEIQVFVKKGVLSWLWTYGIWVGTFILLVAGWWWVKRPLGKYKHRYKSHK
ncbi:hypothetical protein Nstercoris_02198 [Nitrosomonas stercoris]|uniref:Uncharacterized protein n=1 Tax=Nitrosomonas stercoris TaxID=1444684 RepID=A0A4Y1YQ84_9PROT|nr:hypothetical protein Nstercoris_02198 [Nitrosomonas stercoris]